MWSEAVCRGGGVVATRLLHGGTPLTIPVGSAGDRRHRRLFKIKGRGHRRCIASCPDSSQSLDHLMFGCAQPSLSRTLAGIASREGCTAGVEGRQIEWRRPAPPRPSCRRPGMAARLGWRTPWLCSTGPQGR
jgi:hypothetical protein